MKDSSRIVVAAVLVGALIADVFAARQLTSNGNPFFLAGFVGVVLAGVIAVWLSAQAARPHVLAAVIALFVWLGAVAAGAMLAMCDPVMRPFIVPMVAVLASIPLVTSSAIFATIPVTMAAGWFGNRIFRKAPNGLAYGAIVAIGGIITIATAMLAMANGSYPTPTACVL